MFTDNPVTPVRLQILIDLLRNCPRGLPRKEAYRLLQPEPLNADLGSGSPAFVTVKAAVELELVEEDGGVLSLTPGCRKQADTREAILRAFDARVLSNADVEKYFALFYSYYLGLSKKVYELRDLNKEQWAERFNQAVFADALQENRFNGTKLTGLHRWFNYVGLGWFDPTNPQGKGEFQANPFERVERALPQIFGRQKKLESDAFMANLAEACPDLDGGVLFLQANPQWDAADKQCTLGLSCALVELHLDGVIRLSCPADSAGWNIGDAEPPRDEDFRSARVAAVELLNKA
jgi:hypothetical protein